MIQSTASQVPVAGFYQTPFGLVVSAGCVSRFAQSITSGTDPAQVISAEDFQQMGFVAKFFAMTADAGGNFDFPPDLPLSGHFDFPLNALVEAVSNVVDGLAQFHKSAIWMGMMIRRTQIALLIYSNMQAYPKCHCFSS